MAHEVRVLGDAHLIRIPEQTPVLTPLQEMEREYANLCDRYTEAMNCGTPFSQAELDHMKDLRDQLYAK